MIRTLTSLAILIGCSHPPGATALRTSLSVDDCESGSDDTSTVQSAMTAGTCLEPGTYHVDAPALNSLGRRRDAMLLGGTLCGSRSGATTILFRGDAHSLYWVGVMDADVHDVRLDSGCLTGTVEQSHLVRLTTAHVVRDAVLAHPPRATRAGDDVNVVGSAAAPMVGLVIDHVAFESCARFGVQVSRGVTNGVITNNSYGDGCAVGSESASAVDGLLISHDTFTSATPGLAINAQQLTHLTISHVSVVGRTILLYHCDGCVLEHSALSDLAPTTVSFVSAVSVTAGRGVALRDVTATQSTNVAAPVVDVQPLRSYVQADIHDVSVDDCNLTQRTAAPFVTALGVDGIRLTNSTLTYAGPSTFVPVPLVAGPSVATAPATSVATTGVVVTGNSVVVAN